MKIAFPPIADAKSQVLILGSMPGEASLAAGEYYAFGRNAFWKIMIHLLGMAEDVCYDQRIECLKDNGIALWDVIERCEREGSLDTSIDESTLVANDFGSFFEDYPGINKIFFNGKSVQALFKRHVIGKQAIPDWMQMTTLPSTSPANARLSFENKLSAWREALS